MWLGLLLACAPQGAVGDPFTGALTWEDAWPREDAAASLFGLERVVAVDLSLHEGAGEALEADPYDYVHANLAVDSAALGEVGLRLKGRSGSFRDLDGKPTQTRGRDRRTTRV